MCIEASCREGDLGGEATWFVGGDQCWGEHDVSLRGDQGLRMKGTAASSSVFGRLCAAVGTIVDVLICIRLAGTLGGSTGQEERSCLKWRQKGGQVNTQCMQIHTHTSFARQYTQQQRPRERKGLLFQPQHVNINTNKRECTLYFSG